MLAFKIFAKTVTTSLKWVLHKKVVLKLADAERDFESQEESDVEELQ